MQQIIIRSLAKKKRQVNIELLRIIAMLLVLLNHSIWNAHYFNIGMVYTDLLKSIGVLEVYSLIYICLFFAMACCLYKIRLWCWNRIVLK